MPAVSEDVLAMPASSLPLALLAGAVGIALILLVAWTGLLYFKVLRLSGKDRVHGLMSYENSRAGSRQHPRSLGLGAARVTNWRPLMPARRRSRSPRRRQVGGICSR